jgi:hypothetical protein
MATDTNNTGIGSVHRYEFSPESWTPPGWCLYPLTDPAAAADDLADVVIAHERTSYGNTSHETVRMPVTDCLGRPRTEVLQKALAMKAGC